MEGNIIYQTDCSYLYLRNSKVENKEFLSINPNTKVEFEYTDIIHGKWTSFEGKIEEAIKKMKDEHWEDIYYRGSSLINNVYGINFLVLLIMKVGENYRIIKTNDR